MSMENRRACTAVWKSPLGAIRLECSDLGISRLCFTDADAPGGQEHPLLRQGIEWLENYFRGIAGAQPPLDPAGTEFRLGIWRELLNIPFGATATYGEIARRTGTSPRAAGQAIGCNPICLMVPCHRVIGANGALTGYGEGLERKEWLLLHERVNWLLQQRQPDKAP